MDALSTAEQTAVAGAPDTPPTPDRPAPVSPPAVREETEPLPAQLPDNVAATPDAIPAPSDGIPPAAPAPDQARTLPTPPVLDVPQPIEYLEPDSLTPAAPPALPAALVETRAEPAGSDSAGDRTKSSWIDRLRHLVREEQSREQAGPPARKPEDKNEASRAAPAPGHPETLSPALRSVLPARDKTTLPPARLDTPAPGEPGPGRRFVQPIRGIDQPMPSSPAQAANRVDAPETSETPSEKPQSVDAGSTGMPAGHLEPEEKQTGPGTLSPEEPPVFTETTDPEPASGEAAPAVLSVTASTPRPDPSSGITSEGNTNDTHTNQPAKAPYTESRKAGKDLTPAPRSSEKAAPGEPGKEIGSKQAAPAEKTSSGSAGDRPADDAKPAETRDIGPSEEKSQSERRETGTDTVPDEPSASLPVRLEDVLQADVPVEDRAEPETPEPTPSAPATVPELPGETSAPVWTPDPARSSWRDRLEAMARAEAGLDVLPAPAAVPEAPETPPLSRPEPGLRPTAPVPPGPRPTPRSVPAGETRADRTAPAPKAVARPVQLPTASRRFLEPRVGIDPGTVKIHQSADVQPIVDAHRSDALAVEDTILLSNRLPGLENPETLGVLAHELTHIARYRTPRFVPPVVATPEGPAAPGRIQRNEEEAVAGRAEYRVRRQAEAGGPGTPPFAPAPPAASPARAPVQPPTAAGGGSWGGLPAPWEPMPAFPEPTPDVFGPVIPPVQASPGTVASSSFPGSTPGRFASIAGSPSGEGGNTGGGATAGVQHAETDRSTEAEPAPAPAPNEGGAQNPPPDLDKLARQVHEILKRRLAAERRRSNVY